MNIFILSENPVEAAQLQCNKHIVKMPLESAQMLSTAHRILDGIQTLGKSKSGKRNVKLYVHPEHDDLLYKAVHHNHPCTVWTMETSENYKWHYEHFVSLCDEYKYRYGREHESFRKLKDILKNPPKNISKTNQLTQFPLAMNSNPECMFRDDPVKSYRMFYQTKQDRFNMLWQPREVPEWFIKKEETNESTSEKFSSLVGFRESPRANLRRKR